MKILYGKEYFKRFEKIAEFIEPDSNVLDLCAGDCSVYEYALRKKNVSYTAVDISPEFINYAKKLGVKTIIQDVRTFDIPKTDVILLLDSIYQFPEKFSEILEQAKKKSKLLICVLVALGLSLTFILVKPRYLRESLDAVVPNLFGNQDIVHHAAA